MSTMDKQQQQQQHLSPSYPMPHPTTDRTRERATKSASSNLAKKTNGDTNALVQSSALAIAIAVAVGGCPGECNYDPENGEDLTEIPLSPTTKPQKSAIAIVWVTDQECPPVAIAVPLGSSSLVDKTTQASKLSSSSSSTFVRWILGTLCYLTILLFLASIGMLLVRFIAHDHHMHRDEDN